MNVDAGTLPWTWGFDSIALGGAGACVDVVQDSLFRDFEGSSVGNTVVTEIEQDLLEDRYVSSCATPFSLWKVSDGRAFE